MRSLSALRALIRVELRQARRHAARSWLVIALIAVPVAAMVGGSTLFAITQRTSEEQRAHVMGRAVLRVESGAGVRVDALVAALPPLARIGRVSVGREDVRVAGRRVAARAFELDARLLDPDGLASGMLRVTRGRAPREADEVALSPALAASIGDTVTLASGPARVSGIVVDPESLDLPIVVRAPHPAGVVEGTAAWLVDVADHEIGPAAQRLREAGHRVTLRSDVGARDEFEAVVIFVVVGFAFFEAALVIAAAFAVGLRRRQREIGLLGANGAAIGDLCASLVASAIVLASAGVVLGVALGAGAAAAVHPFLDGWNHRWNGAFEMSAWHVLGAALLGLCAATAAVALPARSATRLPIRVALSGRRPVAGSARASFALGLAMVAFGFGCVLCGARATGAAASVGILGGSILGVLGLGACSPWLLDVLARRAAPLPLAWRLAVRDAGRFRARNGPVVTAVLACMSVSVLLATLVASVESMLRESAPVMRDDQLLVDGPAAEEVARSVAREFRCVAIAPLAAACARGERVRLRIAGVEGAPFDAAWIAVGDDELLRALDAAPAIASLRAGDVVALVDRADAASGAARAAEAELVLGADRTLARVALAYFEPSQRVRVPAFVAGAEALAALGLEPGAPPRATSIPWIVRLEAPVTADVVARAQTLAVEIAGDVQTAVDASIEHRAPTRVFVRWMLLAACVTGLVIVFIATALTSVESAADAFVLHTVGAAPSVLRTHFAARASYLALLGCALAIPAGLIPSFGLLALANVALELAVPWTEVLIVAGGLPVLAFAGAWSFAALQRTRSGATSPAS